MNLRLGLAVGLSLAAAVVWSGEGKVVLGHGWDILDATTDDLLANVEALDKTGLDGVAICLRKGRRSDGTALNCTSMRGAPAWTEEAFEADGRNVRELVKHRSMRQSMIMAWWGTGERLDWRDDAKWDDFAESMAVMARLARKWGLPGIVIDPEDYNRKHQFTRFKEDGDWSELNRLARQRGKQMAKAIFDSYPACRLLTFWTFSEVEPILFLEPKKTVKAYDDLRPAFFNGMMDGLSEKGVIYDGDEFAYTIRADHNDFYRHAWLMKDGARPLVAAENRERFDRQWRVSFGIYPDMHVNPPDSPYCFKRGPGEVAPNALFAMNMEQAAKVAPDLVWVYGEHKGFIRWKGGRKFDRYNNWGTWDEAIPGFTTAIRYAKDPIGSLREDLASGCLTPCLGKNSLVEEKGEGGMYAKALVRDVAPGEIYGLRFALKGRRPRAWIFWHVGDKLMRDIWPVDVGVEDKPSSDGQYHGTGVVRVPAAGSGIVSGMEVRLYADHGAAEFPTVGAFEVFPVLRSQVVPARRSSLVTAWERGKRAETLRWFEENQFGKTPCGRLPDEVIGESVVAFTNAGLRIEISCRLPAGADAAHPAPVFLFGDHRGGWKAPDYPQEAYEGVPTNTITARGYAYVRWNFNDVCPNVNRDSSLHRWPLGIIAYQATGDRTATNVVRTAGSWGTIGAWAWGNSRVMDWIESRPELDATRVAVLGHSRGGKTALWTGAQDERFAMVISNGSGCGGARLGRANDPKAETIKAILHYFPNWFCPAFAAWIDRDTELPHDADDLLRLIAPRLVYVASGSQDAWAGPAAEKAAWDAAHDLYRAYGHEDRMGYHCHDGIHKLRADDWERFMDFADRHLRSHAAVCDATAAEGVTIPAPGGVGDVVALTNALAKLAAVPDAGRRDGAIRLSKGIYDLRGVRMSETSHLVVPLWAGGRIVGLGKTPGETVLRGGGADEGLRVMRVVGGGNYAWTTVSNLTVCGGYTKGNGGGILGSSTVDYRDLVVSNNWALGSNAGGGGGCMQGRAFDCVFADNHAGGGDCVVVYGGGFWTGGTGHCGLTDRLQGVWNCTFRNNTCTWQGGALKVDGIVRGCTYRGNTAPAHPDAVDNYTQKLQLTADEHAALAERARVAGKSIDAYARDAALAETSRPVVKDGETIAFLGDSITSFGSYPAGYINMVMKGLEIAGVRDAKKICSGVGGQTSVHMHGRLARDILAKKPQWMTFSCGVNDVWHGRKGVPLAKYRELVGDILDRCEKAGVKVIVLTATMIGEDPTNENNLKLAGYNDWLRAEAKRRNLPLADLDADMRAALARHRARHPGETGNVLTVDGVHMAFPGNCMMAWGVLRAMGVDPALRDRVFAAFARMPQAYGEKVALTVEEWERVKRRADAEKVSVNEYILRASGVR